MGIWLSPGSSGGCAVAMLIIADKPGQLGNMLFLFSHFIARAREDDLTIANLAFDDYAAYFRSTRGDLFCRYPASRTPLAASRRARRLTYRAGNYAACPLAKLGGSLGAARAYTLRVWETVFPLDDPAFRAAARRTPRVFMRGWLFRDQRAFERHVDAVREFFQRVEEHRANVESLVARARTGADVLVGVHIRHGYIRFENMRHLWYPPEKYAALMGEVEALFPGRRVAFLVCSDERQDPALFARFRVTFGNDHVIEDMYSFAACDYVFGPPSTYTMWASFYGCVPLYFVRDPERKPLLADFNLKNMHEPLTPRASETAAAQPEVTGP